MYNITNCSIVISLAICYIISGIVNLISFTYALPMVLLCAIMLIADTVIYKITNKKIYIGVITSVITFILHTIIADKTIGLYSSTICGFFILVLNLIIAFCYHSDHTLTNLPLFHDPVFGKKAGDIAAILQFSSSLIILHAIIYVGNSLYTIISFVLITFIVVIFTQMILSPQYKEHKQKEKDELIAQIKKEQGYR